MAIEEFLPLLTIYFLGKRVTKSRYYTAASHYKDFKEDLQKTLLG